MSGDITYEISLTWAAVVCFIALLVFIYSIKKGGEE